MGTTKILLLIVLCTLSFAGQCQPPQNISRVEFSSLTRGYQKRVFISPDSITIAIEGRQEDNKTIKRKLDAKDWSSLMKTLEHVTLQEIPDLPSPSSRRAFDGALHSTITLISKEGNSWSHSFDDEDPHEKLRPLMKSISKLMGGASDRKSK